MNKRISLPVLLVLLPIFLPIKSLAAQDLAPKSDAHPSLWDNDLSTGINLWTKEISFPLSRVESLILNFEPNVGELEVDFLGNGGQQIAVSLNGRSKSLTLHLKGFTTNALRLIWRGKALLRLTEVKILQSERSIPKWVTPIDPAANVSPSSPL